MEMILLSSFLLCSCFAFLILGYKYCMLHKIRQQENPLNKIDIISQLPEEIHSHVMSLLPLNEAVRTSVLSRGWRVKWTSHMHMLFDSSSILGLTPDKVKNIALIARRDVKHRFIWRVYHIMQQRCSGTKMNSIVIRFPLSRKDESHITSWISKAVRMGVETINLDLSGASTNVFLDLPRGTMLAADWEYTFPFSVLTVPGKRASAVKHLRLGSCGLGYLSPLNSLSSLVSVEFHSVIFTDEQLDIMLCNCLFLERMVFDCCQDLVNFKLLRRKSRLRYLAFKLCHRLKTMELDAENLEIFEYTAMYSSHIDGFSFNNVPNLSGLYFWFCGTLTRPLKKEICALSRIANDIPRLQTLNVWFFWTTLLLEGVPTTFNNVKHLVFALRPLNSNDELACINYLLKAFPLLSKLQLNQYIPSSSVVDNRQPVEVTNENIRELEINGYHGSLREGEILRYLVKSAVKLHLLVISPLVKEYEGFNDWAYHDYSGYKLSSKKFKELRSIVPKTVVVKYRNE